MLQYELCRHILTNGRRCKSPSLRDSAWCFYHANLHQRHSPFRHTEATRGYLLPGKHIELSALEDRESVQVALSVVINALATGQLETKRATALLYGLQLASMNAAKLNNNAFYTDAAHAPTLSEEGLPLAEPATEEYEVCTFDEDEEDDEDEVPA